MKQQHLLLRFNDGITDTTLEVINEVKTLQQLLKNEGSLAANETVDGKFGPKTLGAVKLFQQRRSLQQDGIVGRNTWAALLNVSPSEIEIISRPPIVDPNLSPQVKAFLEMISVPEGTSAPNGYRVCFTGVLCVPSDFSDHPRIRHTSGGLHSDAAGKYQFLSSTWDGIARKLRLRDFSPANQDKAAVELIKQRGALSFVEQGNIRKACEGTGGTTGVAWEWASLPPGRYPPQRSITFKEAERLFVKFGGKLSS